MLSKYLTALLLIALAVQIYGVSAGSPSHIEIEMSKPQIDTSMHRNGKYIAEHTGEYLKESGQGTSNGNFDRKAYLDKLHNSNNPNGPKIGINRSYKYGDHSKYHDSYTIFPSWAEIKDYARMFKKGPVRQITDNISSCFGKACGKHTDSHRMHRGYRLP